MSKNNAHIAKLIQELQDAKETQWKAQFRAVEDALWELESFSSTDATVLMDAINDLRAEAEDAYRNSDGDNMLAEGIFDRLGRE